MPFLLKIAVITFSSESKMPMRIRYKKGSLLDRLLVLHSDVLLVWFVSKLAVKVALCIVEFALVALLRMWTNG